ncbi:hypothetical protein VNO80_15539 [Phaseolus coccineus]|uniref:Uncharacterized protein n=1 Tax=Phaseolus coccineus TaxID=3886 RepID=A0AAN9R2E3_PHACN
MNGCDSSRLVITISVMALFSSPTIKRLELERLRGEKGNFYVAKYAWNVPTEAREGETCFTSMGLDM